MKLKMTAIMAVQAFVVVMGISYLSGCVTPDIKPPVITIPPITIPTTTTTTQPPAQGCGCDLSLPICDFDPVNYPPNFWDTANIQFEECGVESGRGIISRFAVKHPSDGKIWFLASVGSDQARKGTEGFGTYSCFDKNGYRLHICGYQDLDPQGSCGIVTPLKAYGKYVIVEPRKIK